MACRYVNPFSILRNRLFTNSFPSPNGVVSFTPRKHIACSSTAAAESISSSDAVVVSGDGKYGRKEIISITPRLYDYLLANVREPQVDMEALYCTVSICIIIKRICMCVYISWFICVFVSQILRELREETATMCGSQMQVTNISVFFTIWTVW